VWEGECQPLAEIVAAFDCPAGTSARYFLDDALYYRLRCERGDGTAHGAAAQWDPPGELRWRRGYREGQQHGAAIDYGPQSKVSLTGAMAQGRPDGTWIAWEPTSGRELGRFTLAAGTGVMRSWYPDGAKRSETAYEAGLEHGPRKVYSPKGVLLVAGGAKQGKVHGRYIYYHEDGTPRLVACYAKGKTRWEIDAPEALPKALERRCR
jgi:antitoxin component YwqK of YwqJK toxin-antitoxin module